MLAPFLSSELKFSRVSIGAIEDLGYMVDYNAADPDYTYADLGPQCQCQGGRRRRRRQLMGEDAVSISAQPHRKLSDATYQKARADGMQFLENLHPSPARRALLQHDSDKDYELAPRAAVVYIQDEHGEIHAVTVHGDD